MLVMSDTPTYFGMIRFIVVTFAPFEVGQVTRPNAIRICLGEGLGST